MRSWFRKSPKDSDPIPEEVDEESFDATMINSLPSPYDGPPHPPMVDDPLRPMQYPAPRLETLYISDSERDLYLAALSSLDAPTPPLVLHAEPAPSLPRLLNASPLVTPNVPYPASPAPGAFSKTPSHSRHAILTLVDDSGFRFTGFTADALVAADAAIRSTWKFGISGRSDDPDKLKITNEPILYRIELKGKAWNRKGHQELELLLAVFTALGKYGYKIAGSMASMGKYDTHNLLFRDCPTDNPDHAPLFFALSLPLPDRLALVSPPHAASEELIGAVRASIFEVASEIKMEGWLHPGVYRFWIAGMRSFMGGMKHSAMTKLLPPLMVNLMDSLSALHFEFVSNIPLEPAGPGRDILVFSSTPRSGLTAKDAYVEGVSDQVPGSVTEAVPLSVLKPPTPVESGLYASEEPFYHALPPPNVRPFSQPTFPPFTAPDAPNAPEINLSYPTASTLPSADSGPLPSPPLTQPPSRSSLDSKQGKLRPPEPSRHWHSANSSQQFGRPPRHPGRPVPDRHASVDDTVPAPSVAAAPVQNAPIDRRPSEIWEQIARESTPGRYNVQLSVERSSSSTPIHTEYTSASGPSFPTNPSFPATRHTAWAAQQKKHRSVSQPNPSRNIPTGPTTTYVKGYYAKQQAEGPPVHVDGLVKVSPEEKRRHSRQTANANAKLHPVAANPPQPQPQYRSSLDSMNSMYSSTEDQRLVTPNLTANSSFQFYPNSKMPGNNASKPLPIPNIGDDDDDDGGLSTSLPPPPRTTRPLNVKPRAVSGGSAISAAAAGERRDKHKSLGLEPPFLLPYHPESSDLDLEHEMALAPRRPTVLDSVAGGSGSGSSNTRGMDQPSDSHFKPYNPKTKSLELESLRNVRLSPAFDAARNVRLSVASVAASDFSTRTGGSASTSSTSRPPGVGSARARLSVSRATAAAK